MAISSFRFPTDIRFGVGAVELVAQVLENAGAKRPLLVTDKGMADFPVVKKIIMQVEKKGQFIAVYSDAQGNPVESHVTKGVTAYQKHKADSLIILGGGCALDVGKAVALMATHPGNLFDYEDDKPGALPIDKSRIPFMVAIPTTAGTGSEVGGSSVISNEQTHSKVIVWGTGLIPKVVIADPQLTVSLPASVTAATGIDALTHNIEAFLAKSYHPICEGIALEGIRLVFLHLKTAVQTPSDLESRGQMLAASMMGAISFQKGLGVTHSCAHALSTCYDLHHGLANALMLEPCMEFNREYQPAKFARLGNAIGLYGSDHYVGKEFILRIKKLKEQVGITQTLKDFKVQVSEKLIDTAFADPCHQMNPRPCVRQDFKQLFNEAL